MNPLQAAHLRILESLPRERIRTHEQRPPESFTGALPRGRSPIETQRLHDRINELVAKGLKNYEIAAELRVARNTVSKHRRGGIKGVR